MQDDFSDVQKLLRLKRYETPGEEYFDSFLNEFHQRQRAELIRTPLWQIAWDRLQTFFAEVRVPKMAYVGSFAAVTICVLAAISQVKDNPMKAGAIADTKQSAAPATERLVALSTDSPRIRIPASDHFEPASLPATGSPRYVLETRPVSFGAQNSF